MELPNEVRDNIIAFLYDRRDILSLSRTDRRWSDSALRNLYANMRLAISYNCKNLSFLENTLATSGVNFLSTTRLAILPEHPSPNLHIGIIFTFDGHYIYNRRELQSRVDQPDNDGLNMLTRVLLGKIPKNQLRSFEWAHDFAIAPRTFAKLVQCHGNSLQRLAIISRKGNWEEIVPIAGLQKLCVGSWFLTAFEARLVAKNSETLRDLTLSLESVLVDDMVYSEPFNPDEHIEHNATSLRFCKDLAKYADPTDVSIPILELEILKMIGLDLGLLLNAPFKPLTDPAGLTSLTFESCCGLSNTLHKLAWQSGGQIINNLPNLSSLTVRHEQDQSDGPQTTRSLKNFLRNLSPLRTLRVLLSGPDHYFGSLEDLLEVHGARLQTLVWDERQGQRLTFEQDRLIDQTDAGRLPTIAAFCPNLIELGISIRWDDGLDVPVEGHKVHIIDLLQKLPHLRTLNIRNLPLMASRPSAQMLLSTASTLRALVEDFVLHLSRAQISSGSSPQLRVFGLGALTYRDVWHGSVVYGATGLDDMLRLRVWAIDYPKNARGVPTPLLTLVANGYPGNVGKDISEDMSIFEPYWLT